MSKRLHAVGVLLAGLGLLASPAQAGPAAATICPPFGFLNNINLAKNPSFEAVGPAGATTTCPAPCVAAAPSAAAAWTVHSSNAGAPISTRLEPTKVPAGTDPAGQKVMLHIIAGGNEGGVYQLLPAAPAKMMFQVWVYVQKGFVGMQAQGGNTGPAAISKKQRQWEELRVCSDGSVPNNMLVIYNQDPNGGDFFIDRVEARAIP
jgi:hypothetical protein